MSKALDMMTAAMAQAKHEIACANNTATQLRSQTATLKAENVRLQDEVERLLNQATKVMTAAGRYKQRAEQAERELATLRSQVAALLPKATPTAPASVYGGGAGELDVSRDNGLVTHGEYAE